MDILPLTLVIISAIIHSFWNFFFKKSEKSTIFIFWAKILEILFYFPISFYFLYKEGLNPKGVLPILGSGIVHFFYWLFISLGYETGDLSYVYPIARSSPLFISLLSFLFFNEKITLISLIGIIMIILGVYFISTGNFTLKGFKNFFNIKNKSLIFAYLVLLTITLHSLIDKVGAKYVNPILYVYLFELISLIFFSIYVLRKEKKEVIKKIFKKEKYEIFFTAVGITLSYSIIVYVMNISKLGYIVSIREIGVVFTVLFGVIFLKEKYGILRFISSLLIFFGILLISIFG